MPNGDPISALPVEIWQKILRYSISVPEFFDPDELPPRVFFHGGRVTSRVYYKAEFTLNALRRVCRPWDKYLQRFLHRFVRLLDVMHGKVPLHYIQTAVIISFEDHGDDFCDDCMHEELWPELAKHYRSRLPGEGAYSGLCSSLLESKKPFKAEILDYGYFGHEFVAEGDWSRIFPNLIRVESNWDHTLPAYTLAEVIGTLQSLRHIYMQLVWDVREKLSMKSLSLTTLVLDLYIPNSSFTILIEESLCLPALRNLHVENSSYAQPDEYDEPAWLPLVRVVGRTLRTLGVREETECRMKEVPEEIWEICPRLEDLCSSRPPPSAPPEGHPIHTLSIHYSLISRTARLWNIIPNWQSLRTIRITRNWIDWNGRYGPLTTPQLDWLHLQNLRLEDSGGSPYIG
jgi:hypothetical protein